MDKDAFYFPHFSNARHDRKLRRVQKELGIEGYGIFFMILEVLRDQINMSYPMDDIDLLADEFGTSEQKVRVVICNYGLFEVDQQNTFFSPKLNDFMQPYLRMKEQRSIAGKASAKARKAKKINTRSTPVNQPFNEIEQSKVKESKVKENIYRAFAHLKITVEENKQLIELGYKQKEVDTILDSIENFKKNTNYKSLFLTAKNWLRREYGEPKPKNSVKNYTELQYDQLHGRV